MKLHYATRNLLKFTIAKRIMKKYGIHLLRAHLETPEIQSLQGKEVCEFSARHAARQLNCPVVKSDVSYSIDALNGFPGPYVKHMNTWLTANDVLNLMNCKKNRKATIVDYVTYAEPKGKVKTVTAKFIGKIARQAHTRGKTIDRVFIHDGHTLPQSTLTREQVLELFSRESPWHEIGKYLRGIHG